MKRAHFLEKDNFLPSISETDANLQFACGLVIGKLECEQVHPAGGLGMAVNEQLAPVQVSLDLDSLPCLPSGTGSSGYSHEGHSPFALATYVYGCLEYINSSE